jgi:hypothetical protein
MLLGRQHRKGREVRWTKVSSNNCCEWQLPPPRHSTTNPTLCVFLHTQLGRPRQIYGPGLVIARIYSNRGAGPGVSFLRFNTTHVFSRQPNSEAGGC